jgi:predicted secreted hydrolase
MFRFSFIVTFILASLNSVAQDWKAYPYQPPGSLLSFPKDEGRHAGEPVEWWYTAGHLTGASSGKTYSYMLTYFYYPAASFDGFRILDITDDATGKFYQETKPVRYSKMSNSQLDIEAAVYSGDDEEWTTKRDADNQLIPFEYSIKAASSAGELDLNYKSLKRPLILGDSGYLKEGLDNYTYYYSQTRNEVSGKITLNGVSENVTGTSWIDRQYGDFNPWTGEKYEWFLLQLSNGMDINLWNVFTADNKIPDNSKYRILSAYVNDSTQHTISDFKIERLGFNWMPDSQMCYSDKWRLTSEKNKINVVITTAHNNSEVQLPFRFFEGATDISGTVNGIDVTGFGFAELLHSYAPPQVKITYPATGQYNAEIPVSWQPLNPDEGMDVSYDLSYSTDNKISFIPIAESIADTFYVWKNAGLPGGSKIWFQITAHSIDGKLKGTVVSASASEIATATSQKIKVFPNPVSGTLYFEPAFEMNNPPCRILDEAGHVIRIYESNSLTNHIDVSALSKGIYFFQIDGSDKKEIIKFIRK